MVKFILFRHGLTDWNLQERKIGDLDNELNTEGILQAQILAENLKFENFKKIYSSPLRRALVTAEIIAKPGNIEIEILPELKELNSGILQGKTNAEINAQYPWYNSLNEKHRKIIKAESFFNAVKVWKKLISALVKKHQKETIGLSTHKLRIQVILNAFGFDKTIFSTLPQHGAITIVEIEKEEAQVKNINLKFPHIKTIFEKKP